jgi:DNA-binding response OmpR family regulator
MPLRCLLFSSDPGTAEPICQVLATLGAEGEHCTDATTAVETVASQAVQIVLVDWDNQPEAGILLQTARARKASERPLTLAIVSDDASVPKALQAGANSILRRPLATSQIKDTLTTARDMVRARELAAHAAAAGVGAGASATTSATAVSSMSSAGVTGNASGNESALRSGEFQVSAPSPSSQYDTESEMQKSMEQSAANPLKDLEPVAAPAKTTFRSFAKNTEIKNEVKPEAPPAEPDADEPRGLQWYLKQKAMQRAAAGEIAPEAAQEPPKSGNPELLGFDQMPAYADPEPVTEKPAA